jgi:hypothetical protein
MNPCQNGYPCVWKRDAGTKSTCVLARCAIVPLKTMGIDRIQRRKVKV